MKTLQHKLQEHAPATPSKWKEAAAKRAENKEWLKYSQFVAMKMLDKMEELGLTQKALSERMNCSQQYVSRILKGSENLSIETICKIESVLNIRIMAI